MNVGVKVFAPASVSNVACGYDMLGFALDYPGDEIIARFRDEKGLNISKITGAPKKLLSTVLSKNTAGVAAQHLLDHLGQSDLGIDLEIRKKMPLNTGIGSSAASAVGAVMAINELLKRPLSKRELLPFAMAGEQSVDGAYHADNVAPSLLGGMIFIKDNNTLDVHRLPLPRGIYATVVYPEIKIVTKEARAILTDRVDFSKSNEQSSNLAGLIIGLFKTDLDLIGRSLKDALVEDQRAHLIPGFYDAKEQAMESGVLGCSISGAGPSIFCLSANSLIAENAGKALQEVFKIQNIKSTIYVSPINHEGAVLI